LALLLWSSAVSAAPDGGEVELAKAHFRTGEIYYEESRFLDAAHEFEAAYGALGRPALLYNIGKCYDGAGDLVRARAYYRRYLEAVPDSEDAEVVQKRIAELTESIGYVTLRLDVRGAEVRLDGALQGKTPLAEPLALNPGRHKIDVARDGYATWSQELHTVGGGAQELKARLVPLAPPPSPPPPRPPPPPLYRKWWLWATIGGALAASAVVMGGVLGARAAAPGTEVGSQLPVVR
jgi:tetratricopeptide (TPR) repeat protein